MEEPLCPICASACGLYFSSLHSKITGYRCKHCGCEYIVTYVPEGYSPEDEGDYDHARDMFPNGAD